jgi:uncharacterized OB-fold protein
MPMSSVQLSINAKRSCLIGAKCAACATYFFPNDYRRCRNPHCRYEVLVDVDLSRVGTLWSYTSAGIAPPAPFEHAAPYVPFAIAAVLLEREGLLLLGPVVDGVTTADLAIGMSMELAIERQGLQDAQEEFIWKWRPVSALP